MGSTVMALSFVNPRSQYFASVIPYEGLAKEARRGQKLSQPRERWLPAGALEELAALPGRRIRWIPLPFVFWAFLRFLQLSAPSSLLKNAVPLTSYSCSCSCSKEIRGNLPHRRVLNHLHSTRCDGAKKQKCCEEKKTFHGRMNDAPTPSPCADQSKVRPVSNRSNPHHFKARVDSKSDPQRQFGKLSYFATRRHRCASIDPSPEKPFLHGGTKSWNDLIGAGLS